MHISFILSCTFFHTLTFPRLGYFLQLMMHPNLTSDFSSFSVQYYIMVHLTTAWSLRLSETQ